MNRKPESYRHRTDENNWENIESSFFSEKAANRAIQRCLEEDASERPWKTVSKHQLNPKVAGAVTAILFAATMTLDVVHNGPSSFVVNNPEAATTTLAMGAAAIGALTSKLVGEANANEVKRIRQAERRERGRQ